MKGISKTTIEKSIKLDMDSECLNDSLAEKDKYFVGTTSRNKNHTIYSQSTNKKILLVAIIGNIINEIYSAHWG